MKGEEVMEYYDAHNHFFCEGSLKSIVEEYNKNCKGLLGVSLIVLEEVPEDRNQAMMMVPRAYHYMISMPMFEFQKEAFKLSGVMDESFIFLFLDTRFFRSWHVENLEQYIEKGYKGLKILYIPENEESIGIQGWDNVFGRSMRKSEQMMADMVAFCDRFGLPVLFHADIKRYGDFVCDILKAYPNTIFNVPHFGQSRKKIVNVLETYPNCYTDFSGLLPYMKESPDAYRDFIRAYGTRILFGSDGLFGFPDMLMEYVEFIGTLLDWELFRKVAHDNYRLFHQLEKD